VPSNCGFSFSATNRLRIVDISAVTQPLSRQGALSFDATEALVTIVDATTPEAIANAWPFETSGALKITLTDIALPNGVVNASITRNNLASQQVYCSSNNAIASWSEGLPFDQFGNLCVEQGGIAPAGGAFNTGFSTGFD
jgi:hypothetical protein